MNVHSTLHFGQYVYYHENDEGAQNAPRLEPRVVVAGWVIKLPWRTVALGSRCVAWPAHVRR